MKMLKIKNLSYFVFFCVLLFLGTAFGEAIYTKSGETINGKITEMSEGTIWYETTEGEVSEYVGIEFSNVEKVLNDDGTVSQFSPTYSAPKQ